MNFPKQTKSGSDCQCGKSTAYSNRGAKRTNTVRPHLLDRNHISVGTTPASLSLGIIFTSLISYFYCYVNRRIYSKNMLFLLVILSLHSKFNRVTTITKQIEMYPHVESYIISFALIAIFWVSYHLIFNFIKGAHILNVYAFIGNAFCQSVSF
jgi:hypothetical protein